MSISDAPVRLFDSRFPTGLLPTKADALERMLTDRPTLEALEKRRILEQRPT